MDWWTLINIVFGEKNDMDVLYCNLISNGPVSGHKQFDYRWSEILGQLARVSLLSYEKGWYEKKADQIEIIECNSKSKADKDKLLNLGVLKKGFLRKLQIREHVETIFICKKVLSIAKAQKYDYIFIGGMDFIVYLLFRKRLKRVSNLVLINHSATAYQRGMVKRIFSLVKEDFIHVVMEGDGVKSFSKEYGIDSSKIFHIPHMLNSYDWKYNDKNIKYDFVGISNSNSDDEVRKIIEWENEDRFFEKNGIKAIFRSSGIDYETKFLKVFSGRLGLSYDDYYSYICDSRAVIMPFPEEFGYRSSGTLMDSMSQNKPVLGTRFGTLLQYNRQFPNICKVYSDKKEFKSCIIELMETDRNKDEFVAFKYEHSDEVILKKITTLLCDTMKRE